MYASLKDHILPGLSRRQNNLKTNRACGNLHLIRGKLRKILHGDAQPSKIITNLRPFRNGKLQERSATKTVALGGKPDHGHEQAVYIVPASPEQWYQDHDSGPKKHIIKMRAASARVRKRPLMLFNFTSSVILGQGTSRILSAGFGVEVMETDCCS